jgi:uncharacterized protein (TIRG00374 family)
VVQAERPHGLTGWLRSPSKLALIALNLVAYYFLLRWLAENIQIDRLVNHFGQIPAWAPLGSLFIYLTLLTLYGMRMALLLGMDFRTGFSIINIGYALNTLIPLRLGEAMKIYLGRRFYGMPLTALLAASVAERLADLLVLLVLGFIVAALTVGELVQASVLLPVIVLAVLGVTAFILFRLHIVRIVKLFPKGSRLRRISIELHKHTGNYPVGRILAISLCVWALDVALAFFTFNTYLPGIHISILDAGTLLLIMVLAIAIPSAPAGLGLFEAGIVAYLTQKSGVSNEAALAAAAAYHLVVTLPQVVIAGGLLWERARLAKGSA